MRGRPTKLNQSGTTKATCDQFLDFDGQDDLVLIQLDAVRGQPGNQDFTFDTDGDSDTGEIRLREVKAGVLVELNVDNDAAAELSTLQQNFTGTLASNDVEG